MRGSGLLIIASLTALVIAGVRGTWGLAQPGSLPDGTFVRAADGTIYAVSSGAKIRLVPAPDAGNVLGALRDGPTAATVDELWAALAAVAPTPVISNPAQTLIGQSARVCAETGFPFQADVVDAQWLRTVAGREASGPAMFVVVFLTMTNLTNNDLAPYRGLTAAFALTDERGRKFGADIALALFDLQHRLAADHGLNPYLDNLRPGIGDRRVVAVEVAPDVQRLTLTSEAPCP